MPLLTIASPLKMTVRSNAKAKNRSHLLPHPKIRSHSFPQYSSKHWSAWLTALC